MKNHLTKHHVIPKSRENEGFKVHHPDNISKIGLRTHENLHRLFDNKTPQEQLYTLLEINKQVISRRVYNTLRRAIESGDFYMKHLLK